MSPKYRFLLALLLTLVAICSQVVFGQTKTIAQKVQVGFASVSAQLKNLQHQACTTSGAIDITPSGGTSPYTFLWTGPSGFKATSEDLSNLNAGSYTVMVSDANGCSYTSSWSVSSSCASACNLTDVSSITNATSCSSATGSITVTINGGSGNYGYTWYNNNFNIITNSKNLTNVVAGNYYLEVTDLTNPTCVTFFYYTIETPFKLNPTVSANTTCISPYTGSINATISGGSGNYTFTLTHPSGKTTTASTSSFTGLSGGAYKLAVQDNIAGCKTEKSLFISNTSSSPLVITETVTPLTMCSPLNGAVALNVTNGSGTYTYSWLNQTTGTFVSANKNLTSADAAPYTIYVQDALSGCNASKKIVVENKTMTPAFSSVVTPSTSCAEPNGIIDITMTSAANYSFSWLTGTETKTTEDLSSLTPGEYLLQVTDLNTGCISPTTSLLVTDQSAEKVNVTIDQINSNTNCAVANGSVQITVQSNANYALNWTGPNGFVSTLEDITGLDSGTYIITTTVNCNQAPVIEAPLMKTSGNTTLTLNLEDIIMDPDNNLDLSSFEIIEQPESGAQARIENTLLQIEYASTYKGTDNMRIRACDLLDACTENALTLQVEVNSSIIVYNAVAPNSPGDNQFMRIENLPTPNKVSIFNRWGDAVFAVNNYESSIPGKRFEGRNSNGNSLPTGTYFYKIELDQNVSPITGYLSLKQ